MNPPRTQNFSRQNLPHQNGNFFPNQFRNYSIPNSPQHNGNSFSNFPPPRPLAPKPQSRPIPMDVDHSMQSRAVNYMNRPRPNDKYIGKRPAEQSSQPIQKFQRNFHIEPEEKYHNYCGYPPEASEVDFRPENGEPDYVQDYFQQIPEEMAAMENEEYQPEEDQAEINFLE